MFQKWYSHATRSKGVTHNNHTCILRGTALELNFCNTSTISSGREGNTGGMPAGPAPVRTGGRLAPGVWDPRLSSGAEATRVEGGRVPPDVGSAGGQLVYTQGQSVVWAGHCVMVEPDLSLRWYSPRIGAPSGTPRSTLSPCLDVPLGAPGPRIRPPARAPPCADRVAPL